MRRAAAGLVTAFSLYSAILMPRLEWDRDSMQYALCFFPLVGAVTGGLMLLWYRACLVLDLVPGLFAAVAVLLPLLVSGGIHLDGFVDTVDAMASHASPEKRLEIMKDPRTGAFGVMGCCCLLLLQAGLWMQVYRTPGLLVLPLVGYVLSRSLNAWSIAAFPCARQSGLVHAFSTAAARSAVRVTCVLYASLTVAVAAGMAPVWAGALAVAALGYLMLHRRFCIRQFGGNTGDLAGFLLQNIETGCLILAALGGAVQ